MIQIVGPRDRATFPVINTTSSSKTWSRGLSPFILGPVTLPTGQVSLTMENAWQYSKVYPCHVDERGEIKPEFYQWQLEGFSNPRGVRYPMGKGSAPLFSLMGSDRLGYIQARKLLYMPLYSQAVQSSDAFKKLAELVKTQPICLFDYDGYDHEKLGMTLDEVIHCEHKKMGHAFVLKMLLLEHIVS